MQQHTLTEDARLLDVVMKLKGYASTNRGRKAIKEGFVKVSGKVVTFPAAELSKGDVVQIFEKQQRRVVVGAKSIPFPIHHDDKSHFVFEKPAGWLTASPDVKRRTAYSTVKPWLLGQNPKMDELYFVNKLPKEASGLIILAKDAVTRTSLQREWSKLDKRYYVLAKGQFEEDGEIGKRSKVKPKKGMKHNEEEEFVFPYRRMMQGRDYALLRVTMKKEAFSELFSLLEQNGTPVPGYARRGKADNPIGRLGFHFFSIELPLGKDKTQLVKTPVPREFLNLIKFNAK